MTAILGCIIIVLGIVVWGAVVAGLLIWMALYTLQPRH